MNEENRRTHSLGFAILMACICFVAGAGITSVVKIMIAPKAPQETEQIVPVQPQPVVQTNTVEEPVKTADDAATDTEQKPIKPLKRRTTMKRPSDSGATSDTRPKDSQVDLPFLWGIRMSIMD